MELGDRVLVKKLTNCPFDGENLTGKICIFKGEWIGIEFDMMISGHNCEGTSKDQHGWYVLPDQVIIMKPLKELWKTLNKSKGTT